ncbi:hypothetical protein T484DRAFT_1928883 [Baffinella frigidus]|nr:hypothetical protein T484DRAFT_1928883 [Cryptophyta sp. CCMP2293]
MKSPRCPTRPWMRHVTPLPSTLNSQPSTLNPQPSTLNPQPSTFNAALTRDEHEKRVEASCMLAGWGMRPNPPSHTADFQGILNNPQAIRPRTLR